MLRYAVVLPGASYGVDQPGLAIPVEVARAAGFSVTCVAYPPAPWPDWRRAEAGDWSEIIDALAPQLPRDVATADDVLVIAKSMGTSVVGGLAALLPGNPRAIWITPLFHDPDVRSVVIALGWRCLSVFGTADPAHDPVGQREVTAASDGSELSIERASHRMIVEGDEAATQAGYDALERSVTAFLASRGL